MKLFFLVFIPFFLFADIPYRSGQRANNGVCPSGTSPVLYNTYSDSYTRDYNNTTFSESTFIDNISDNNFGYSHLVVINDWDCSQIPGSSRYNCTLDYSRVNQDYACLPPCSADKPDYNSDGSCKDNPPPACDPATSIMFNGKCTKCPDNSHPNSDQSACDCDDGYSYDGYSHSCSKCVPPEYFNPRTGVCDLSDCQDPFIPAPDYDTSFKCVMPEDPNATDPDTNSTDPDDQPPVDPNSGDGDGGDPDDPNNCPHPDTLHGTPFVGIMDFDSCIFSGGWTFSCPEPNNNVACYRYDQNQTDPNNDNNGNSNDQNSTGGIDSNNTTNPTDTNGTGVDLTDTNNKLDQIIDKLAVGNDSLGDLGNIMTQNSNKLGDKLDRIDSTLKTRLEGMNDNLGNKLDAIKNSIDNKPVAEPIDMTETNDLLRSIDDRLHEDHKREIDDIYSKSSSLESVVNQAIASVTANYNDIVAVMNGLTPPSLSLSGSCNLSVVVLGKTLDLGKGFRDALPILRPVVMFIFNLIFAVLLIRFSILAYRDIQLKAFALFS